MSSLSHGHAFGGMLPGGHQRHGMIALMSVHGCDQVTIRGLAEWNVRYEDRYGFLFLVCATGKSAEEMLRLLMGRMNNTPEQEVSSHYRVAFKSTGLSPSKAVRRENEASYFWLVNEKRRSHYDVVLRWGLGLAIA